MEDGLHYQSAIELAEQLQKFEIDLRLRHKIRWTCESYFASISRLHALLVTPALIVQNCLTTGYYDGLTQARIGPEHLPGSAQFNEERKRVELEVESGERVHTRIDAAGNEVRDSRLAAIGNLSWAVLKYPILANALRSIYAASLLEAWTAFETLASDLWRGALDIHPRSLASLSGNGARIARKSVRTKKQDDESSDASRGETSGKQISLDDVGKITAGGYDLSQKMGTLLHGRQKWISLNGIRSAYSLAFSKRSDAIDATLASPHLDALHLVRNLIVHKAGKVDAIYESETANVSQAPRLKEGDVLTLTGQIVRDLVEPAYICGKNLIVAVDNWINESEDKERTAVH